MRARKQLVELLVHSARQCNAEAKGDQWSKVSYVDLVGGRITQAELDAAVEEAANSKLS